jgi:serine/threonine protein kinase
MALDVNRVESLFRAAATKEADSRAALLERECGGDPELRQCVEALLRVHDESSTPSPAAQATDGTSDDLPAGRWIDPAASPQLNEAPGSHIGPYKLLQILGEGGMGAVYLAEQEEPVKRRVALKIIKAGLDSARVIARFEAERQALAMMDHPNIAKVLDAGTTNSGRPFFVMELVKGIPITKYCDQEHLTPRERLELFIPVCQAVQHAHQKGIIHRDLKPTNVLIALYDGKPIPKVIDFGVAKATVQKLTDRTMFTEVGQIVGTVEYMAPEQAELNNLDIDTRADIYSLGVLLYELLTGTTPFTAKQLRGAAYDEMLRMIREVEPPKPSTKVSRSDELPAIAANRKQEPNTLAKTIRGDLDWIVMKCLEKERSRRYETANGLGMELQRYLADEPVLAGPPRASYRMKKFLRRNRHGVMAAGLLVVALVAGLAGTSWGLVEARHQRDRALSAEAEALEQEGIAQANFDKARQTVDLYFTQVSENKLLKSPLPGMQPLRQELLSAALKYYREFADEHGDDPRLQADLAAAYLHMGVISDRIDSVEKSLPLLQKALEIFERLERDNPSEFTAQADLAETECELGHAYTKSKRVDEALRFYERAVAHGEQLVRDSPNDDKRAYDLARYYSGKGWIETDVSKGDEAMRSIDRALTLLRKITAEKPHEAKYPIKLADVFNNRGEWRLYRIHEPAKALKDYEEAVAVLEKLPPKDAEDVGARISLSENYRGIANCYFYLDEREKCLKANQQSTAVLEKLARQNPRVIRYQSSLATGLVNLGQALAHTGKAGEARNAWQRAIEVGLQGISAFPSESDFPFAVAQAYGSRGTIALAQAQFQDAMADEKEAVRYMVLAIEKAPHISNYSLFIGNYYSALGKAQLSMGLQEEARKTWQKGPERWEQFIKEHPTNFGFQDRVAEKLLDLSLIQGAADMTEEMRKSWRRAVEIGAQVITAKPDDLAFRSKLAVRAQAYAGMVLHKGLFEDALAAAQKGIELQQAVCAKEPLAPNLRQLAGLRLILAIAEAALHKPKQALDSLRAAREALEKMPEHKAEDYYLSACIKAQTSSLLADDQSERARQDADEAIQDLTRAVRSGFKNAKSINEDPSLAPLRSRKEFQELVADLAHPK